MATQKKAKRTRKKAAPRAAKSSGTSKPTLPRRIFANVSPHSIGGVSLFDVDRPVTQDIVTNFCSEQDLINRAVVRLQEAGFDVLQVTEMTINIAGSAKTYDRAFGCALLAEDRPTLKSGGVEDLATFVENPKTDRPGLIDTKGTAFEDVAEGVALEEPYYLMAPAIFPPPVDYWHLDVPGDVAAACNAEKAHRSGITGKGVKVAMVDTG